MKENRKNNLPVEMGKEESDLAQALERLAHQIEVPPLFQSRLEKRLIESHKPKGLSRMSFKKIANSLSWAVGLIVLALALNWVIRSIAPQPQPAHNATPIPVSTSSNSSILATYDWHGTTVNLAAPFPQSPAQANVFTLSVAPHATADEALALAKRFGIDGEVYQTEWLMPGTMDYFITDGKQSITINSSQSFDYVSDMVDLLNNFMPNENPNAEAIIGDFLKARGFDFQYRIEPTDFYGGGYQIQPLAPDGFPIQYEFFSSPIAFVKLNGQGEVLDFQANLVDYESVGTYEIITAEEAFQKFLSANSAVGIMESARSVFPTAEEWRREYPINQTITIYGYASSTPALDESKPPFVQIDAYQAIGNIEGMDALERNTYVEATGQFVVENGIKRFNVETWKVSEIMQDGLIGTLRRDGDRVILSTDDGEYTIPDAPADIPMPYESAYVVGTKVGNVYEWTLIDDRFKLGGGGGGGGGGGTGFYKLNLTGTPVPLPQTNQETSLHVVMEGDTLDSIAQMYGTTIDELIRLNKIADANTIFIGQVLVVPMIESSQVPTGQSIEGQRGFLNVTIYKNPDGSERVEYGFTLEGNMLPYVLLEGDNLQALQNYHNRPIDIWGTLERYDENGRAIVKVDRYEIPFPDLQFQIMRGKQKIITVDGQPVTLFTTNDGESFVQWRGVNAPDDWMIGSEEDEVVLEVLIVPGETYGGYPALRVFGSGLAISPKNGKPIDMQIMSDKPVVMDSSVAMENFVPQTLTIEKVELVYFATNQRFQTDHLGDGSQYIQPVWRFYGHYSDGRVFEVLVQALKDEFLLPEIVPYIQGG